MMNILDALFIFAFGCVIGWIVESVYRSIITKRLLNAGFLNGPYVPLYGFGVFALHLISSLNFSPIIKVLIFGFFATFLEFITGFIFETFYKVRLWDYSNEPFNFKGYICMRYTFYWMFLASIYLVFISEDITKFFFNLKQIQGYSFFIGMFYGIFIIDIFNSFNILLRLKDTILKFKDEGISKFILNYDHLKSRVSDYFYTVQKNNFIKRFFISMNHITKEEAIKQIQHFLNRKKYNIHDLIMKIPKKKTKNKKIKK